MGRHVTVQPNGKLAIFSSVVDDFTALHATEEDIIQLYVDEAIEVATDAARRSIEDAKRFRERFEEDLTTVQHSHGIAVAQARRAELSKKGEGPC